MTSATTQPQGGGNLSSVTAQPQGGAITLSSITTLLRVVKLGAHTLSHYLAPGGASPIAGPLSRATLHYPASRCCTQTPELTPICLPSVTIQPQGGAILSSVTPPGGAMTIVLNHHPAQGGGTCLSHSRVGA